MRPWIWRAAALAPILAGALASPAFADDPPKDPSASEVVVTGNRPEVVDRIDRRVYNTESDPLAQTGTAADILESIP